MRFNRRLLVAYLIEHGVNTVPKLMQMTGWPNRSIQKLILSLADMNVQISFVGAKKNGQYQVTDWASLNKAWICQHVNTICELSGLDHCRIAAILTQLS
ncbi:helix-turn-helix domain-containing protein (plasmid) [Shewanella aestuarii]|uniref:Helix-turn-helix domain-containing protein n=2 Tax=Shewanella aestuarii TaxID=1028752 RepID=A0A6G9QQ44_9GAMM|nr:helix-turn-helix domain-containing protein [Shewanella aestuarii]